MAATLAPSKSLVDDAPFELIPSEPLAPPPAPLETSPLDDQLAKLLLRLNGAPSESLERAAAMVSAWRSDGHSCMPLAELGDVAVLRRELFETRVVGRPDEWKPLILDGADRLYLHRYWKYEQSLAASIRARLAAPPPAADPERLLEDLSRLLPPAASGAGDKTADQRAAIQAAFSSNLCVITGGPGTGKTRTIAVILALLHRQAERAAAEPPRVLLAAPTGKAAIRMTESIRRLLEEFPDSAASLAGDAATLHRLLGLTPDSPLPRYDAAHPLAADLVIVDEASMIDLALMAKLFSAVPPTARLILLGDRDQLASVEAGRVLGDICAAAKSPLGAAPDAPLPIAMVELRENFRFAAESGIRRLSELVNAGDADGAIHLLKEGRFEDLKSAPLPIRDLLGEALRAQAVAGFRPALEAATPAAALEALAQFRILCAVREGAFGVANLNRLTETALARAGLITLGARHYQGQPIMILRNDYNLRLFNGDIGLILPDETADGALRAFFRAADGQLRRLQPARLPEHETAWAITVHKSQGSEFDRLLFILPDEDRPLLTRELIYTAITRARSGVEIWHRPAVLKAAIARRTLRMSGLADAIRAEGSGGLVG